VKRPAPEIAAGAPPAKRAAQADRGKELQKLPAQIQKKIDDLKAHVEIDVTALQSIASSLASGLDQRDVLILLQALQNRIQSGTPVSNVARFITGSLEKRLASKSGASSSSMPAKAAARSSSTAPPLKASMAKAPTSVGKSPVAKAPVGKAPVVKATIAKAPGAGAPGGAGKAPVLRQGLEFEQQAVQAKLQSLNKTGIWAGMGSHPLDEAALASLLAIDSGRALEILDEAEEKGPGVRNPSAFVISKARENPR